MKETWKPIAGYEGLYEVSDLGRVRALNYGGTSEVRVRNTVKDNKGYLRLTLTKNGVDKTHKVHRLVALAFVEGRDLFKNEVNHLNENKEDNRAVNLEWCDTKHNVNYGTRTERATNKRRVATVQLTLNYHFIAKWESIKYAEIELGIHRRRIVLCCQHKYKTTGGYRWFYLSEYEEICFKVITSQHPFRLALPYRA